jgi:hypothetical protein
VFDVFKDFHARVEKEISRKLKCIQLTMVGNTRVLLGITIGNMVSSWRR